MMTRRTLVQSAAALGGLSLLPLPTMAATSARAAGYRYPEETDPHERTLMQWPVNRAIHDDADFLHDLQGSIAKIAHAIAEFEPVVMLAAASHHRAIRKRVSRAVELWDVPTDDLWCRDLGPFFVVNGKGGIAVTQFNFNGWGNKQVHGNDGQVRELWPLDPDRVQALLLPNKSVVYDWSDENGVMHRLLPAEMLHLRHRLGPDGVLGVSPIQAARGVVEMAIKEVEHGTETFSNGAKLLGVLKVPGKLSPSQKGDIKEGWQTKRSGQTPILEHGAEFQQLSMSLVDAQWLESRKFSVEEVARLFRVPPPIIGHLVDSNYSTASELARQWIAMGLSRPLVMWEQAVSIKCLTPAGRRMYTIEHDYEGLLRGSSLERAQFYQSAIAAGWMDKDEVRRMEYLPKQEGSTNAPQDA